MKYGIIARLGSDSSDVRLDADEIRNLTIGLGAEHDVNVADFIGKLGRAGFKPNRTLRDLLLLAICVYVADTRIDRGAAEDGWTREIALSIPVGGASKWREQAEDLQRILNFLTGDRWRIKFRESKEALKVIVEDDAAPEEEALVSLFSGGLDSFIGALDLLSTKRPLYLVGHYGFDPSATASQGDALAHVRERRRKNQAVNLINSRIAAGADIFAWGNDTNMRSRSLIFVAMGLLVADAARSAQLYIPENGFISLNVPLNTLRLGTYSTRTTHPHFIAMLQVVLKNLGSNIALDNPYRFSTKGEMLLNCKSQDDLLSICADTMSCAHPLQGRYKGFAMTHCGRCTACIIRRGAFHRAFGQDKTEYILDDLSEKPLHSDLAEGKDIRAIRMAAERVRSHPASATFLVLKPGPLPVGDHERHAELYRRGMNELWNVVEDVKTVGSL